MSYDVISVQKDILSKIYRDHVGFGDKYALIDFPNHSNVGDSAIWLGEIAILTEITGNAPSYVSAFNDFNLADLRRLCPEGPIFIHGGGNVGDIWSHHQNFREDVITWLQDRKIVQLPQTVKFHDKKNLKRFSEIVSRHNDFHMYVRDVPSHAVVSESFDCPVTLAPDSAFGIGALARDVARHEYLLLLRTDAERADYDQTPFEKLSDALTVDWLDDDESLKRRAWFYYQSKRFFKGRTDNNFVRSKWFTWLAEQRVERGRKALSQGRIVITDRLHAHIMSILMDMPHIVIDNDYGKIFGYMAAWTHSYPKARQANSAEEVFSLLA